MKENRPARLLTVQSEAVLAVPAQHVLPASRSTYSEVAAFFDDIARHYDLFLANPYWSFASELLELMLVRILRQHFGDTPSIRFLDAGAGTGTWSSFLLRLGDRIEGVALDLNTAMLNVAHRKLRSAGHEHKVEIVEGNLEHRDAFPSARSNLILCLHNVIGMGRDTDAILRNLVLHLEPGGVAVIMAPNKRHALRFNAKAQNAQEVRRVLTDSTVKFKTDMPEMFCFTSDELRVRLRAAGFDDVEVLGFPVTIHPEPLDPHLGASAEHALLRDPRARRRLLDLELQLCFDPSLADRAGDGLLAVCKRHADGEQP
jgi:SAM-dependent methyltransferase